MVVILSGAFEQFVRRILRDSVSAINAAGRGYDALENIIKRHNVHKTGVALQTIFEPLDHLNLDYELLSRNLGTCFSGSTQAVLNADAFSIFSSAMSPEKIVEALKRIGVDLKWDSLGKLQAMQSVLEKGDTRETTKAIEEFLKWFGQTRNKISHTGSTGIVITESEFRQFLKFFRTFSSSLASVVETDLRKRHRV